MFIFLLEIPKWWPMLTWILIFYRFTTIIWRNAFLLGISHLFQIDKFQTISYGPYRPYYMKSPLYITIKAVTCCILIGNRRDSPCCWSRSHFDKKLFHFKFYQIKTLPFCHFIQMLQKVEFSNCHFSSRQEIKCLIDTLKIEISYFYLIDSITYHMFYIWNKNKSLRFKDLHQNVKSQHSSSICFLNSVEHLFRHDLIHLFNDLV